MPTQLSHTRGRTHTECWYPWHATMADPATSPQTHVSACAPITHHRRQHHSAIQRHRVVRTAWCTMGPVRASGDIRARGTFRCCTVRSRATRAHYTRRSFPMMRRHGGMAQGMASSERACMRPSVPSIDRGLVKVFVFYWPSRRRSRG